MKFFTYRSISVSTLLIIAFTIIAFQSQSLASINLLKNLGGPEGDKYLPYAEVMPEPADGLESVYKFITYPSMAKQAGVEGKVYLLIFVSETGNVDDVKVVKGIGAGCDEAAVEGVKKVKFKPGKNGGKAVKVKLSLPVIFKL